MSRIDNASDNVNFGDEFTGNVVLIAPYMHQNKNLIKTKHTKPGESGKDILLCDVVRFTTGGMFDKNTEQTILGTTDTGGEIFEDVAVWSGPLIGKLKRKLARVEGEIGGMVMAVVVREKPQDSSSQAPYKLVPVNETQAAMIRKWVDDTGFEPRPTEFDVLAAQPTAVPAQAPAAAAAVVAPAVDPMAQLAALQAQLAALQGGTAAPAAQAAPALAQAADDPWAV